MKKGIFLAICILYIMNVFAVDTLTVSNIQRIADGLKMPGIQAGDKQVVFPAVPEGYVLELKGTDRLPVVDAQGHIGKPLTDAYVRFYFTLTDQGTGETLEVTHLDALVPGECTPLADANACPEVIPSIREWCGGKGVFLLEKGKTIVIDPAYVRELQKTAEILVEDMNTLCGLKYEVKTGNPGEGDIYLTLKTDDRSLGEEGYRMTIGKRVDIEGVAAKGVFWGTRTLLQLAEHGRLSLPVGKIRDYPKYARRGFMLDVARKFFRLEFLQAYVRIMAYYKMNEFHVHLNDNGFIQFFDNDWDKTYAAFRLECETFPGLTAKDGFYTKRQFTDLQLQGMDYGVNVVPEIDVPAHSLAFSHYRKSLGSRKYGMDHLDLSNPEIYPFLDSLFREYLGGSKPVFVGPEVHIGTDEYAKEEAEGFRKFTDHYLKYVQGFGKRARLWGALTHAQGKTPVTSENVIMNVWYNGYADPKEMIKEGYELISTPDGWLYIVPAAGYYHDYLNLGVVYDKWEPIQIGNQLFPAGHPQILGGTFAVWNDHCGNGISEKDVHHRTFPAMQVLAQKMWAGRTEVPYEAFAALAGNLSEAPGVNLMGKVKSAGATVLEYRFATTEGKDLSGNGYDGMIPVKAVNSEGLKLNGKTMVRTPVKEIGYDYAVEFEIAPASGNSTESVLFRSPDAVVVYTAGGQLGFRRDGYFYTFDYQLKPAEWQKIKIEGDAKGTTLYVDGKQEQRLEGKKRVVKDKNGRESTMYIQQTLVFPLEQIGDTEDGFTGKIRSLKVTDRNAAVKN